MRAASLIIFVALCLIVPSAVKADGIELSADCEAKLDMMWANYTSPTDAVDGCDAKCLAACKYTLEQSIEATKLTSCPKQEDISRCFQVCFGGN